MKCLIHSDFFDDSCDACEREYPEMKNEGEVAVRVEKYKEFTEIRAKKLYEELMLQYLKSGASETEADRKAKSIIRKQCTIRGKVFWPWI